FAAQQVPTVRVDERQRIALVAIAGAKPALEVDTPHGVGAVTRGKWLRQRHDAPCPSPRHRQAAPLQGAGDAARSRPDPPRVTVDEPRAQLSSTPAGSLLPCSDDVLLDVDGHSARIGMRSAGAVLERTYVMAGVAIASDPEITGRPADAEHAAQFGDVDPATV